MLELIDSTSMPYMDDRQRFSTLIEPYRSTLQAYCRSIAHSSWEADDLVQDTWLKAYRMFLREPSRSEICKTYLFRIAHNTWVDVCRKRKHAHASLSAELEHSLEDQVDPLDLQSAVEALVANLPARQRIFLLLIDMFGFTASETAQLVHSTEGAVKAGLHRARAKLKSLSKGSAKTGEEVSVSADRHKVDEHIVYAYLQAFQQNNPYALVRLFNEEAQTDYVPVIVGSAAVEDWSRRETRNALSFQSRLMAA